MGLFETHLRELGDRVDGSFLAFAQRLRRLRRGARDRALHLADLAATSRPTRAATCRCSSAPRSPPPTSRWRASRPRTTSHRLTLFADNLVPHVLRIDGVLEFDDDLVRRIDAGTLLEHDSARRSRSAPSRCTRSNCSSQAHPEPTTAAQLDWVLWTRGGAPRYKAHPRHRAPTTAY